MGCGQGDAEDALKRLTNQDKRSKEFFNLICVSIKRLKAFSAS